MNSPRKLLIWILLLAIATRVPLMFESLWFDEYYTTRHTIGTLALLLKSLYTDIHPPAYYAFMTLWTNVFGDAEFSIRTPPLLCGLGTVWLVFALGRDIVSARTGLIAAAIVATSPLHIWYSTEARPYSTQLFLLLLTVHAYGKLMRAATPGRGPVVVYSLSIATLVFTHYYMAAYAVAFSALAFFDKLERRRAVWLANVATLALMGAYVAFKLKVSEFETARGYLREFTVGECWQLFYDWFLSGYVLSIAGDRTGSVAAIGHENLRRAGLVTFQAMAVIATVAGVIALARNRAKPPGWHVLAAAVWLPLFLLALALIGRDQTYIERSALPAYPFFVLVLATGLAKLPRRALVGVGFAILQIITLATFYGELDTHTVYRPNPDWRAAAAYLGHEIDTHGAGLDVYTPYASPDPLAYYDPRIQQAKLFEPAAGLEQRLLGSIDEDTWWGTPLIALARSMHAEFEATKREKRATAQMLIHQLAQRDPLATADRSRPFYVVYPGDPDGYVHPGTAALIERDDVVEIECARWRWLRVHKLRFSR